MLWYAIRQLLLDPDACGCRGDVVVVKLRADGAAVCEETIEAERKRLGLDKPLYQQFAEYMLGLPRLDLGKSLWTGEPSSRRSCCGCPSPSRSRSWPAS